LLVAGVIFFAWLAFGGKTNNNEETASPIAAPVAGGPLFTPQTPPPVPSTAAGLAPAGAQNVAAGPLNPAHGQPGHRCDIAVGAPLNSAPSAPVSPVQAPAPVVSQNPAPPPASPISLALNPAASGGAAGKNPAHGQPGHRCDIAVGAPLDSKPAPKPATINNTTPQVAATPANPPVSPQAPVVTAPGKNPPHGQPGHRCDIAVGASLDSAAKKQ
jgi:hypothetical protein